jgi:multidrug efflux pump subunit AcrA (membrane-fusion protein)
MKKKLLILSIVAMIVPVLLFVACSKWRGGAGQAAVQKAAQKYTCPMHPNYVTDKAGDCPICGMTLVKMDVQTPALVLAQQKVALQPRKKIIRYRSTMNPNEISDKPGKDSMGMEMEPFEVEETPQGKAVAGLAPITVSPEKQQLIGVRSAVVQKKNVTKVIRTVGKVAYDPDLYYAEQEYVSALKAAVQAKGAVASAIADNARSLADASRLKLRLMGLGDQGIEDLAAKGAPDTSLLLAKGSRNVWIYASIFESDLRTVKPGQGARISAPSVTSEVYDGRINAIDPVLDPQTRNARARIRVENKNGVLKPEVYVNVEISVPLGSGLVVPADAVMETGTRQIVFVDKGNGVLEPREIKTVTRTDDTYLVQSGVDEGEKVVTNANFLVDSESQLKAAQQQH